MNMQEKIFERYPFGKAALNRMGEVPDNFRLYRAGWDDNRDFMTVYGAEFEADSLGFLSKKVEGTEKKVIVSVEEINEGIFLECIYEHERSNKRTNSRAIRRAGC